MKPILYTTHCPKCQVLTKKLDKAGIEYDVCEDIEVMESKGLINLPALEVNGEMLDFVSANKWVGEHS